MTRRRRPTPIISSLATHQAPYVTLPSLRLYWQVEYQTLHKWVRAGILPAYRFGRMWRIRTDDARAFEQRSLHQAS
jgi:excisionase family DNA binding protein